MTPWRFVVETCEACRGLGAVCQRGEPGCACGETCRACGASGVRERYQATHYTASGPYTLRVLQLPSGAWWASAQLAGACAECLGDAFPDPISAKAAAEYHALA